MYITRQYTQTLLATGPQFTDHTTQYLQFKSSGQAPSEVCNVVSKGATFLDGFEIPFPNDFFCIRSAQVLGIPC